MSRARHLPPWLWAPAVLGVDFITKRLVLAHADAFRPNIRVIDDLVRFAYVRNGGAAMGLFHGGRLVLIVVSALTSLVLLALTLRTSPAHGARRAAFAAILGGALGNLVDRVFYGGLVVDFIDLGIGTHRFYTFNVADMGVTLGGAALLLTLARSERARAPEPESHAEAREAETRAGPAGTDPAP